MLDVSVGDELGNRLGPILGKPDRTSDGIDDEVGPWE
jgi:hypothetical protein